MTDYAPAGSRNVRWWEGAVIYQVYVRSWCDTDGDGTGDLRGVTQRLDYLSWLGGDGIWLSPTMPSPNTDWGYDVADYFGVQADLGTVTDLEHLVRSAQARGIHVLLDLVPNHTSSAHPWFVEARSDRHAAHRDWYVWADPLPGGRPPNNWRGANGASAWTLDESSGQFYLHNFLPSQPDLNWWNPAVHDAFETILRYWFDRGIAGFRIDVAHALYKDAGLRDDPVAPDGPGAPFGLLPVHSKNRPEVHRVYEGWRRLAEEYRPPRLLLGETWVFDLDRLRSFYGADNQLQLAFNFSFTFAPFTAQALRAVTVATIARLSVGPSRGACPVWMMSNHDVSRAATRWCEGDSRKVRLSLAVVALLPGTLVLYYGDELGLVDVALDPADQKDPMTWNADDGRFNRDRARTPMPWDESVGHGFSEGTGAPWLPIGDRRGVSVAHQTADPASVLHLARRLLALRHEALCPGVVEYEDLPAGKNQWIYRSGGVVVAANFSDAPALVDLPQGTVIVSSLRLVSARPAHGRLRLAPWEAVVVRLAPPACLS